MTLHWKSMPLAAVVIISLSMAGAASGQSATVPVTDRTTLPIPEPVQTPIRVLDIRDAVPPPRFDVKAPKGAPNIIVILLDDMGFGQSSAFGGPIRMATLDRLAGHGLRYNNFHTTALCSPTRAALLTGRNHHRVNAGSIMETATSFPGNTSVRPASAANIAEVLRLNGYTTAAFGKWHETPAFEVSESGPTDRWPTRSGFDKFYGFMGGETNQWAPKVYDGMTHIELPEKPGYHFMTDMADQAINWTRTVKSFTPDKPFFLYFAPGATHAPHHVSKEWIAKYKGKFDKGWDVLREETLVRQKRLGVVPANTALAPKPAAIKDWKDLSQAEQTLFARQMEVFAGFGEMADHEIGRLLQAVEDIGQLDNTLILYVVGDNGASAEGGMNGLFNEATYFNGVPEDIDLQIRNIDELGGPMSNNHYAAGWAVAGDTPFTWTKQVASDFGGTRNGLVVSWPSHIKKTGEVRSQFHHVTDLVPTILEAATLPHPDSVNGTAQMPFDGVSMGYSFSDAKAPERHKTQYFEMFGNRAIYHDGWFAGTIHMAPWDPAPRAELADDKWVLYNVRKDFSLIHDLAAQNPAKLKELQDIFHTEAVANHVLPIDDRRIERFNAALVGRPDVMAGRGSLTLYPGMTGIDENVFINMKNRSFSVTADVDIPATGANGVLLAQGGRFGGWSFYLKDGRPAFTYNYLGLQRYTVAADTPLASGRATLRFEFAYDGGRMGAGGTGQLLLNGKAVASGRIDKTQAMIFAGDPRADVGADLGTPVTEEYGTADTRFTGAIRSVTVDVAPLPAAAGKGK